MARAINKEIVFDGQGTAATSKAFGCTNAATLKVQLEGTGEGVSLSIKGRVGNEMDYENIAIFKDSDLSQLSTISTNGTYSCDITGFDSVVADLTAITSGNIKVCLKAVE